MRLHNNFTNFCLRTGRTLAEQYADSRVLRAPHASHRYPSLGELIFEVRDAEEGGYWARALGHAIFTQADSWEELRRNILEVTTLHFEENSERPRLVQLH